MVPDTLEVGGNSIGIGPLMQTQVLTVTASVPGVQQRTNKEIVLQEGRSVTRARRCHILRVVSLHKQSTKFMQGCHRATQKNTGKWNRALFSWSSKPRE